MTTRTVALLLSSAVSVAFSLAAFSEPAPAPAPAAAAPASAPEDNGIAEIAPASSIVLLDGQKNLLFRQP